MKTGAWFDTRPPCDCELVATALGAGPGERSEARVASLERAKKSQAPRVHVWGALRWMANAGKEPQSRRRDPRCEFGVRPAALESDGTHPPAR